MTTKDPTDQGAGRPEFDSRRSAEIRSLLVGTVAATPRARPARLSRTAFSLAATAALLFAGGVGAGTVVAYDRLVTDVVAQDASAPVSAETGGESSEDALDSGFPAADTDLPTAGGDLAPILTLNGEIGYAYRGDLQAARLVLLGATADAAESSESAAQVPVYRADGVTVLGYFDPASLVP